MPMITVRYVTPRENKDLHPRIAQLAARLAHEKLGKVVDGDTWGYGGRTQNARWASGHAL